MEVGYQIREINRKLNRVANSLTRVERQRIHRLSSKPLIRQARQNVQHDETIQKSIKSFTFKKDREAVYVGVRIKGNRTRGGAYHAIWEEYGYNRGGKEYIPGIGFMRKAFHSTKEEVRRLIQSGYIKKYRQAIRSVSNG